MKELHSLQISRAMPTCGWKKRYDIPSAWLFWWASVCITQNNWNIYECTHLLLFMNKYMWYCCHFRIFVISWEFTENRNRNHNFEHLKNNTQSTTMPALVAITNKNFNLPSIKCEIQLSSLSLYIGTSNAAKIFAIASNFSHYIMKFTFSIWHRKKKMFCLTYIDSKFLRANQQTCRSKSNTIIARSWLFQMKLRKFISLQLRRSWISLLWKSEIWSERQIYAKTFDWQSEFFAQIFVV